MDKRQAFDTKPPLPANTANSPYAQREVGKKGKAPLMAVKGQPRHETGSEARGGPKKDKDPIGPGSAV